MTTKIYLVCNSRGFFIAFSYIAVRKKCKLLQASEKQIYEFSKYSQLEKFLVIESKKTGTPVRFNKKDLRVNQICWWSSYGRIVAVDLQCGWYYYFWRDGLVEVFRSADNRKLGRYQNCPDCKLNDTKTVNWVEKYGYILAYDFEKKESIRHLKNTDS